MSQDLSPILKGWPDDPGVLRARKFRADDGGTFLQLRLDLGVLQMTFEGRPDGHRPYGFPSMLELLLSRQQSPDVPLELTEEEQEEIVREMLQFYHRRICLMALARKAKLTKDVPEALACFRGAIRDADHNLALLDLIDRAAVDRGFAEAHKPYRPFILTHRATCAAECALLERDADQAIEHLKTAIARMEVLPDVEHVSDAPMADDMNVPNVEPFVAELRRLERQIRRKFDCRRTLREQLDDALALEDFETAARLRDVIDRQARTTPRRSITPDTSEPWP